MSFSAQGQIIFFDDFESYANTAQMNAVGNWGDNLTTGNPGTLVTTGGNPGQHMFHPAGQSAQHSIAAITPTNMQPIVWSFDFFDTFPLTNKRVTGGLRNTSNSQILEMGWFNSVSNPETSTTISGYAVRTVGVGGAPGNWVTFQGNPTAQAGWHNFTATIFASHILFELDFGADGIVNANRIVTTSTGGSAAYNVLRLGGPSDLTSTGGGAGFDNVSLALFQPTKGIFNTGIGDMGNALLGGAVDPHFTVHTVAAAGDPVNLGVGAPTFVVQEGFPIGPWMANTPDSKWISSTLSTNDNPGFYDYNLVFDLIGNAGLIEGRWSVDNAGVDIFLNGVSTGNVNTAGFASWTDFMIDDGFLTGENVLTFRVENFPPGLNPAGLRVEFLEFLDFTINVPEPSAMALWVLIGLALLGTAGARRRRKMS